MVTSVTGYRRTFPIADAGSLWLATRCQGRLLDAGHGAPVRLVAPGRRGFWWVKWVASVELSERAGLGPVAVPAAVTPDDGSRPTFPVHAPPTEGARPERWGVRVAGQLQPLVLPQPSQT